MLKLFTHNDLDGMGCAVLAKIMIDGCISTEYCDNADVDDKVKKYLKEESSKSPLIMITDMSVKDDVIGMLEERGRAKLLDHHPTAIHLNNIPWCEVRTENEDGIKTSGTEMFYEWIKCRSGWACSLPAKVTATLEKFVRCVRDYDTWRWKEIGKDGALCKQLNDLFFLYGRDRFEAICIQMIRDGNMLELSPEDKLILDVRQKEIEQYIREKDKQLIVADLAGFRTGFVFAENFFSELGNRLCEKHPELDLVAMIDMGDKSVSYRTVKDSVDVGKDVAKLFGGGGHPKAAGSQFEGMMQDVALEAIFCPEIRQADRHS